MPVSYPHKGGPCLGPQRLSLEHPGGSACSPAGPLRDARGTTFQIIRLRVPEGASGSWGWGWQRWSLLPCPASSCLSSCWGSILPEGPWGRHPQIFPGEPHGRWHKLNTLSGGSVDRAGVQTCLQKNDTCEVVCLKPATGTPRPTSKQQGEEFPSWRSG